jgi:hypothetical protein
MVVDIMVCSGSCSLASSEQQHITQFAEKERLKREVNGINKRIVYFSHLYSITKQQGKKFPNDELKPFMSRCNNGTILKDCITAFISDKANE